MSQPSPFKFTWTEAERSLIACLINPDNDIEDIVPRDPEPGLLWENLTLCLRVHRYATRISGQLKPLIGRFLLLCKNHPESYQDNGYSSYGSFIRDYVVGAMGISRSALYECKMIAERLPGLSPQQVEELGITKVKTLASFSKSSDSSFAGYLEMALEHTATDFLKICVERGLVENGVLHPFTIIIQTDEAVAQRWEEFCSDPQVQAYCGSASSAAILDKMMQEVLSEWTQPESRD